MSDIIGDFLISTSHGMQCLGVQIALYIVLLSNWNMADIRCKLAFSALAPCGTSTDIINIDKYLCIVNENHESCQDKVEMSQI